MAKSTRTKATPIEKKAGSTVADLRQFYKMGVEANAAAGNYGDKVNERVAEKYGRKASNVSHARNFAKLVDETELEKICNLRNSKGEAFGRGVATKLFPLKKRKDRDRFLRLWQRQSLSARGLEAAIRVEFGKSGRGGRKSSQPTSQSDAIQQLHDRCSNWLGWYEQLADEEVGDVSVDGLPTPIQKQLKVTMRAVKKLRDLTTSGE